MCSTYNLPASCEVRRSGGRKLAIDKNSEGESGINYLLKGAGRYILYLAVTASSLSSGIRLHILAADLQQVGP